MTLHVQLLFPQRYERRLQLSFFLIFSFAFTKFWHSATGTSKISVNFLRSSMQGYANNSIITSTSLPSDSNCTVFCILLTFSPSCSILVVSLICFLILQYDLLRSYFKLFIHARLFRFFFATCLVRVTALIDGVIPLHLQFTLLFCDTCCHTDLSVLLTALHCSKVELVVASFYLWLRIRVTLTMW